ncbi:MAG: class B sortase [Sarcina sp.]
MKIKKRSRKRVALGILLITIIIVGLGGIHQYLNYTYGTYIDSGMSFNNGSGFKELENIVTGDQWKEPIYNMVDLKSEYDKALSINPNVKGWIFVQGTNINYPVMHGQADEYYLTHNWKGQPYWNGCIALDQRNTSFNNDVTLINGHNMLNGIMFSELTQFENKSFFDANHPIYVYDGATNTVRQYQAIAALYVYPNIPLNIGQLSQSDVNAEVNRLMSQSIYPAVNYNGKNVLLLNTCLSNGSGKHLLLMTEQVSQS